MEKNRRNRVALLGALFVTGLVLAGLGTAFGAGAIFQEKTPLRLEAISEGDFTKIVVFGDGEEIGTLNVSKTGAFSIGEMPVMGIGRAVQVNLSELLAGGLEIITCEKNLTEGEKARAKEIALSDSRVQERIEGKEYEIKGINAHMLSTHTGECELLGASVFIDLPEIDKWFNVNVGLEEGKVTRIGPLLPIPKPPEEQ